MSAKPAWLRRLAAIIAWGGVTAVAATGSWLGMSSVLTGQPSHAAAATVVTPSTSTSPSAESTSPRSRSESSPSEDAEQAREEWNGWTAVGEGVYERSFYTPGGNAVVRLLPGEVVFVSASPTEGFTARKEQPQSERLVVTFYTSTDKVTIDSMWRDGEPYALVSEA